MNSESDKLSKSQRVSRAASAPTTYALCRNVNGNGNGNDINNADVRKNNYPINKMDTQRVSRTNNDKTPDARDKKKSSKLEIFYDRILGEGSFAKVYVARYKGKLVAVKIVDISNAKERHIRQFKRELDIIRILRKHPHPNIPEYYKIIESVKRIIIVMEWCRGGELSVLIKSGLDMTQIKYYFSQILSGYLHLLSLNIIHRDMKSQNVMLTNDLTQVKIIDFGLSKVIHTDMTRTVVGSPAYMAPERLGAQDYDSTSDIWSLGIILYEMIYHINPFHSCKNKATLIKSANIPIDLPTIRHCNELVIPGPGNKIKTIIRKTETVPLDVLNMMSGMLNIDPIQRHDWNELSRLNETVMSLNLADGIKLQEVIEFYRAVRVDAVNRSKPSGHFLKSKSSENNSSDSKGDSQAEHEMFNMDIDGMGFEKDGRGSKVDSEICLDGSDQVCVIRTRTDHSKAIPIPARNRAFENGSSPCKSLTESLCNIAGASVEERQLECLEDYFLLNDPGVFSLYEERESISPSKRVKATDSGFVDVSFLDSVPFLQGDYKEPRPYDILKSGSYIGSMIYSKSAPVMTGVSRLAKKAGSTLTNIISPPS